MLFYKDASKGEILNDADGNLVNFWRVLQSDTDRLIQSYEFLPASREIFDEYKRKYLDHDYADNFERAHIFYYLNRAAFGADMASPVFGTHKADCSRYRPDKIRNDLTAAFKRIQKVTFEHKDYSDIFRIYDADETFFYIDPPYKDTKQYKIGTFRDEQYIDLANICRNIRGKCLITLNDHPFIRETFADFHMLNHDVQYSVCKTDKKRRAFKELIITNYEISGGECA